MTAKLNPTLSDRLRELGNIGCSHALTALSQLTQTDFVIRVPDIEWMTFSHMPGRLGDAEEETVSVMLDVTGEIEGVFLLLLKPEIAARIVQAMGVREPSDFYALSPRARSALLELGNIMCSAYMTAVSQMTGLEARFTVPAYAFDMLGAILSLPIIRFAQADTRLLYIQNVFTLSGQDWAGSTLFLPRLDSAKRLSERLGAWL